MFFFHCLHTFLFLFCINSDSQFNANFPTKLLKTYLQLPFTCFHRLTRAWKNRLHTHTFVCSLNTFIQSTKGTFITKIDFLGECYSAETLTTQTRKIMEIKCKDKTYSSQWIEINLEFYSGMTSPVMTNWNWPHYLIPVLTLQFRFTPITSHFSLVKFILVKFLSYFMHHVDTKKKFLYLFASDIQHA